MLFWSRPRIAAEAALLVGAGALSILLSPLPPESQRDLICAEVRPIGSRAHILVNCDAGAFVELARDPSAVLEPHSVRQTRPGYGVVGWIAAWPFRILNAVIAHPTIASLIGARSIDPFYAGYVAINAILLIVTAILLGDLLGVPSLLAQAAIVPTAVLLVNHITKAFFWTPHLQIFSLFASMLTIWASRCMIVSRRPFTPAWTVLGGTCVGLACLIYGVFLLLPVTVTAVVWLLRKGDPPQRKALHTGLFWAGVLLPMLAWRAFVVKRTGTFYSHETEYYREFVWIAQALATSPASLLRALQQNLVKFLGTVPYALGLPIAFLAAAFVLSVSRARTFPKNVFTDPTVQSAATFLVVAGMFYLLLGLYDPRLTATLTVPLLVIGGALSTGAAVRGTSAKQAYSLPEPVTLAAVAYAAIVILLRGPYA